MDHAAGLMINLTNWLRSSQIAQSNSLPYQSAQAAELIALTRACQLYKDKPVTIYTDSKYAFGVVHDHGVIWSRRGFVAADGKGISHSQLISDLLAAVQLPSQVSILHCKAHTSSTDPISRGNALADFTARQAAQKPVHQVLMPLLSPPSLDDVHLLAELQTTATKIELTDWVYPVLQKNPKTGLICKEGKPCIPQSSAPLFIAHYHGLGHNSKLTTFKLLSKDFYIKDVKSYQELGQTHADRVEIPHTLPSPEFRDSRKNEQNHKRQT